MSKVDVVVVAYNSRSHLRAAVEPLTKDDRVAVVVVDNASADGCLETVADLDIRTIRLDRNGGFAHGCNTGLREGEAPYVLFLNPDAVIEPGSVLRLASVLEEEPGVGAVAPKIVDSEGRVDISLRRFPRARSTFAQALFLHRFFPRAPWVDEVVREPSMYERPGSPDWVSGACLMLRRTQLEQLGGWDQGFFLYCEDIDLCRRVRATGLQVRFDPSAVAVHEGGASHPRAELLPVLAASRIRYAAKHGGLAASTLERAGVALGAFTHMLVGRGAAARRGHARALATALRPSRTVRSAVRPRRA